MNQNKNGISGDDPTTAAVFPVEIRDVYVPMPTNVEKQIRFHAVVDVERSYVFAVVGNDYKLITNEDAINSGRECFGQIFQLTDVEEMMGFNAIMPKTRSFCHLDFLHKKRELRPLGNGDDVWQPYLRVSNSYNKTYALNFDLGFCRWICKNGLIFGKKNIEFKFTHSKRSKNPKAEFRLRAGDFAALETQFTAKLVNLQRYHVPRRLMWPLCCKVYGFAIPEDLKRVEEDENNIFMRRRNIVQGLTEKYFGESGENGYAAINVLTDYATRPTAERFAENRINGFQRMCGDWMSVFVSRIESREFDYKEYLGDYYILAT